MLCNLRQFVSDEDGASMVEYGLLVALIAVVVAGAAFLLGSNLKPAYNKASTCLDSTTQC